MPTFYVDTGGAATNSGCRDSNTALASGASASLVGSVFTLDGSPDLSTVVTTVGLTQDTIYIANSTVANRKIFPITAVDNTAKTVTVSGSPAVSGAGAWAIGGRVTLAGLTGAESALQAGDVVTVNNTPASAAGPLLTFRNAGSAAAGYVKVKGAVGVTPILTATSGDCISGNVAYIWLENLEFRQTAAGGGTTQHVVNLSGSSADNWVIYKCKITDSDNTGIQIASAAGVTRVIACEISGCDNHGINANDSPAIFLFNYIHDNGGDGIISASSSGVWVFAYNILDTNGGQGFSKSSTGTTQFVFLGNTIYNNGESGIEYTSPSMLTAFNNILLDNGDAASEYNIEGYTDAELFTAADYNCLSIAGSRGGGNYTAYTAGANDITSDPQMTAPATGDFSLGASSPARNAGISGAIW